MATNSTSANAGPRRFHLRLWPTLITLVGLAVLLSLGTWQLQRLAWKRDLIAAAEAQLTLPATGFPAGDDLTGMDFRRFAVQGRYLHEASFAFGVQAFGNRPGARLITPFRLADGRIILVDRGWLPEDLLPPRVPPGLQPTGELMLEGIARWRADPGRNWLTPADRPDTRRWFAWDIPAIARASGLDLLPVVLTLDRADVAADLPRVTAARPEFRNNHLGYAITWYGLAAGLLAVYLLFSFTRDDGRAT